MATCIQLFHFNRERAHDLISRDYKGSSLTIIRAEHRAVVATTCVSTWPIRRRKNLLCVHDSIIMMVLLYVKGSTFYLSFVNYKCNGNFTSHRFADWWYIVYIIKISFIYILCIIKIMNVYISRIIRIINKFALLRFANVDARAM